jgi:hypothetical protein
MVERFYSVSVGMADGKTKELPARGASTSDAYQQARAVADVRRVGKVTEITRATFEAMQQGKRVSHAHPHAAPHGHTPRAAPRPAEPEPAGGAMPLRGPRVVMHARTTGGERPFAHLKPPPERPKPPKPPEPPKREVVAPRHAPAAAAHPAPAKHAPAAKPAAAKAAPAPADSASPREYRIVKSRRQGGEPYLLQRGVTQLLNGKKVFTVEWEKGFAERAGAERHLDWVHDNVRETAEVTQTVG